MSQTCQQQGYDPDAAAAAHDVQTRKHSRRAQQAREQQIPFLADRHKRAQESHRHAAASLRGGPRCSAQALQLSATAWIRTARIERLIAETEADAEAAD